MPLTPQSPLCNLSGSHDLRYNNKSTFSENKRSVFYRTVFCKKINSIYLTLKSDE